jgi:hypothetical protein
MYYIPTIEKSYDLKIVSAGRLFHSWTINEYFSSLDLNVAPPVVCHSLFSPIVILNMRLILILLAANTLHLLRSVGYFCVPSDLMSAHRSRAGRIWRCPAGRRSSARLPR